MGIRVLLVAVAVVAVAALSAVADAAATPQGRRQSIAAIAHRGDNKYAGAPMRIRVGMLVRMRIGHAGAGIGEDPRGRIHTEEAPNPLAHPARARALALARARVDVVRVDVALNVEALARSLSRSLAHALPRAPQPFPVLARDSPCPRSAFLTFSALSLRRFAPENTIAAFESAILKGATHLEIDIRPTADGQLVCIHDSTVDRTTNGTGRVDQYTLAEIKQLDAGSWFAPQFADQRVPLVSEVFDLVRRYNVSYYIDFKVPTAPALCPPARA